MPYVNRLLLFPNWIGSQTNKLQKDNTRGHSATVRGPPIHANGSRAAILNLEAGPPPEL